MSFHDYSVELDDSSSSFTIKPCNLLPCVVWLYVACFHMCIHYQCSLYVIVTIVLPQASPEQTKKQQDDADRVIKKNHEHNRQAEQEPKERDGSEAGKELPVPQERKSGSGKAMLGQQLCMAADAGDAAKASTLLSTQDAQSFINYQDAHGATPMFLAAVKGHAAVTEQLLKARCNVDLQDKNGFTPLHWAACRGQEAVTEQFIVARCNVDLQDNKGFTPLHMTAAHGHAAVTKQLLAARCNVDLQMDNGFTALQLAEHQGHTTIATLIRNKKLKSADRGQKDTRRQASPEEIKKKQEDADRAMKELLKAEEDEKAAAAAGSKKKKQAKAGKSEKKKKTKIVASLAVRRLSQENDDDDGLADASSTKKKNKSKKKMPGDQGASASQTAPWPTEAKEAGVAATVAATELQHSCNRAATELLRAAVSLPRLGVEAKARPPPLQAEVEKAPRIMSAAAEAEAIFMSKFNLSPSDAEEEMREAGAPEEEMREAGAREGCEATRGVGGVLARNNIAAVPKENKGKTKMKGAQEASGASGGRQDEEGMCADFADLSLEPSLGLEPLNALVAASSAHVDSRECDLANATHIDLPRFQASPGICII